MFGYFVVNATVWAQQNIYEIIGSTFFYLGFTITLYHTRTYDFNQLQDTNNSIEICSIDYLISFETYE